MNEVYTITSDQGDEYKLQFTTDRSGVISDALLEHEAYADMIAEGHQKDFGKPK